MYEAFGQVMSYEIAGGWQIADPGQPTSGSSSNNRLANTKERDVVLGLDNHGFRYYDPEIGRYTTRDPIGYASGTMNVYGYVENNPVNTHDPLGLGPPRVSVMDASYRESGEKLAPMQWASAFYSALLGAGFKAEGYDVIENEVRKGPKDQLARRQAAYKRFHYGAHRL